MYERIAPLGNNPPPGGDPLIPLIGILKSYIDEAVASSPSAPSIEALTYLLSRDKSGHVENMKKALM